jgi:hypothetical protein
MVRTENEETKAVKFVYRVYVYINPFMKLHFQPLNSIPYPTLPNPARLPPSGPYKFHSTP